MTDLYLIAHKVRGAPAFDIATRMVCRICQEFGDDFGPGCHECDQHGFWWIIPTSGHRAYPYWDCQLEGLCEDANVWPFNIAMPEGLPDHYTTSAAPQRSLVSLLGLIHKPLAPVNIKRRL